MKGVCPALAADEMSDALSPDVSAPLPEKLRGLAATNAGKLVGEWMAIKGKQFHSISPSQAR
jgi:hypothetical protein